MEQNAISRMTNEVPHLVLADINDAPVNIEYQDDELVVTDDIRDLPNIAACKIEFNMAVLCVAGKMQFEVGGEQITLTSRQVIVCRTNTVFTNLMASPDISCRAMCVSDRILKEILQSQISIWNKTLYPNRYVVLNLDDTFLLSIDLLASVFRGIDSPLRRDILLCLLRADFLMVCNQFVTAEPHSPLADGQSRMEALFHRFLENIARREIKKASVAEYASELCITPKYLSTICRKLSGKSPTEWISEYVVEEIVYYLKNTDVSIKEISHLLGFDNPSHFGKFVKAHLGQSPQEYRKSQASSPSRAH
ncbi:MAG: AraC family transcriptional regulator [Muribaculaceae bacterium]|nr:AraC family transcriptional regulator [Muribaculaceae bacterium]